VSTAPESTNPDGAPFGIYVHVPFCRQRCDYCAFATYTDRDHLMRRYVDACVTQIHRASDLGQLPAASSVFFGGGTPSRLPADELVRILDAIRLRPGAEVTVECNPEDADDQRLVTYRLAGVNRVSFGVQSTQARVLASLGRRHGPPAVFGAAALAAAGGFATWNLDLIFGAAGESESDWDATLMDLLSLPIPPPHLSVYALTIEPGTPLWDAPERHPDDDVQARRYERTDRLLAEAGYRWEEISNWARPGHECLHNHLYWHQGDYFGIGAAAHSHRCGTRSWAVRTPERFIEAIETGGDPIAGSEVLDESARRFESLTLSLRTPRGIPSEALVDDPALDGLIEHRDGRAVLTVRGRLLANEVCARVLA
jgi:putative oxygen-independent coproporphyrinogen III oxidase